MFFFYSAVTKRSKDPYHVLPMVDIKIFCANSSVKLEVFNKMKKAVTSIPMFDSKYVRMVDTGDMFKIFQAEMCFVEYLMT